MLWFKNKKNARKLTIPRMRLQVEMVQCLLNNGYDWDQIFNAIGFSEVWFNHIQRRIFEQW